MPNYVRTVVDVGSLVVDADVIDDGLLTFGGAATVKGGTILARDSVSLKYVPFVKGGATNQNGIPKAVVLDDITATGAGDLPIRALVKGVVNLSRLIINADGNGTNIDNAVIDQLRDYGITPKSTKQLAGLDN